ncbi:beta-lactamase family protein [Glycomyces sp. TRM65418]|uniref:serine hydrolase domain-containing protein n=1 Tax=Glycomyces sp. TRM65418 TaxID=2867006 RepID=UPI001CE679F9|nr:serine hydrolase domain-containing protein [Glycomyces sp. TRM65418]MCC3763185.1 beta-lactamase family protein [Glycomyces sp. TRM65418]QZD57190.1 beta-lactamase family protein [Glycomyces sp. TRM65418]
MHLTVVAAALAALTPFAGPLPQAPTDDPHTAIADYLEARFEETGVPGAAYSIIDLQGDTHTYSYGIDGSGEPVDLGTPFLWGSVAKPVTATAAMTLVEDGLLDLDAPGVDHLPDFALADEAHSDRITVRHLLEQTSGIPEGTDITDRFEHREDPYGEAVADLADVEPFAEPGDTFEYASANYLVVGAVVEAVTGVSYEEYLRTAVLEPLGMDTAILTEADAETVPDGHTVAFGQAVPIDTRFDQTGPSYGYLGGTVTDLERFAVAQLGDGSPVLSPESLAAMHAGAAEVSDSIDYGLGWRVDSRNEDLGTSTVWHTGAAPGFAAGVLLLPELDRALVVAQNRYGHFEEGPLIGTMLGAVRMLAGGEAGATSGDPLYPVMLTVLSALVVGSVFLVVWTLARIRKGPKPVKRKGLVIASAVCWALAALAVAYVGWVAVPGLAPSRAVFFLFAPDAAWLLAVLGTLGLLVAAVRLWHGLIRLRRLPSGDGTAP